MSTKSYSIVIDTKEKAKALRDYLPTEEEIDIISFVVLDKENNGGRRIRKGTCLLNVCGEIYNLKAFVKERSGISVTCYNLDSLKTEKKEYSAEFMKKDWEDFNKEYGTDMTLEEWTKKYSTYSDIAGARYLTLEDLSSDEARELGIDCFAEIWK